MGGVTAASTKVRDRDFRGAFLYGGGLVASALLAYGFNAAMGRRLNPVDFGTFAALLGVLLALSGPTTALLGGAAMAAARSGRIALPPWRMWILAVGVVAAVFGLAPLPIVARSASWFTFGCAMWMLVSWNRGLLIGVGRLGLVGTTMIVDGVTRLALAMILVARGWGVTGAAAGLSLGIGSSFVLTQFLLPTDRTRESRPLSPEVWAAVVGLFFLTVAQFPDVVAIRLANGAASGSYAAASSIARIALYAQGAAAAYALRRAAVAGARRALGRSLLLAMAPGMLALAVVEAVPRRLLSFTYGGRYVDAANLVRILGVALALSGLAFVLVSLMMGAGRTSWAWSVVATSVLGTTGVFALGSHPYGAAFGMLVLQAAVLAVVIVHSFRLFQAERQRGGEVVFLMWRDTRHPQGGGSEVYVEEVARGLAASGRKVTIFCGAYVGAEPEETVDGVRFLRRGSWRTVYLWAAIYHVMGRFGPHEVVVDVQNGIPFLSPLYCGRRVVVLVHHVHREQWRMLFGRRMARAGWWMESRLAPVLYRRSRYVAVSDATRGDLVELGVDPARVSVVRNGTTPAHAEAPPRDDRPTLAYLGRLVPHKRIDLLLEAAARLRPRHPGLQVEIVGQGSWDGHLQRQAAELGIADSVRFRGFVDERTKRALLGRAWALVQPSVKEGWGLSVVEAAAERTPAVAFRVGGLTESIVHGKTGLLADTFDEFVDHIDRILGSPTLRDELGAAAMVHAGRFTWENAARGFGDVLAGVGPEVVTIPTYQGQAAVEPV